MPSITEIERLLVTMEGDATKYEEMLHRSQTTTTTTTDGIIQKMNKAAEATETATTSMMQKMDMAAKTTGDVIETVSGGVKSLTTVLEDFGANYTKISTGLDKFSTSMTKAIINLGGREWLDKQTGAWSDVVRAMSTAAATADVIQAGYIGLKTTITGVIDTVKGLRDAYVLLRSVNIADTFTKVVSAASTAITWIGGATKSTYAWVVANSGLVKSQVAATGTTATLTVAMARNAEQAAMTAIATQALTGATGQLALAQSGAAVSTGAATGTGFLATLKNWGGAAGAAVLGFWSKLGSTIGWTTTKLTALGAVWKGISWVGVGAASAAMAALAVATAAVGLDAYMIHGIITKEAEARDRLTKKIEEQNKAVEKLNRTKETKLDEHIEEVNRNPVGFERDIEFEKLLKKEQNEAKQLELRIKSANEAKEQLFRESPGMTAKYGIFSPGGTGKRKDELQGIIDSSESKLRPLRNEVDLLQKLHREYQQDAATGVTGVSQADLNKRVAESQERLTEKIRENSTKAKKLQEQVKAAEEELKALRTFSFPTSLADFRKMMGSDPRLKTTEANLEDLKKQLSANYGRQNKLEDAMGPTARVKDEVEKLTRSLKEQIYIWGKTGNAATLARAEMEGMDDPFSQHFDDYEELKELVERYKELAAVELAEDNLKTKFAESMEKETAQYKDQIKNIKLTTDELKLLQKQRDMIKGGVNADDMAEAMKMNTEALKERDTSKLKVDILDTIEKLKEEMKTFGMTSEQIKLYKLQKEATRLGVQVDPNLKGMLEMKRMQEEMKKLEDRGKDMTKELRTPMEKYKDTVAEINKVFEANKITPETYARAMEAANKQLEDAEKNANGAATAMGKFDAATYGSAEATQRFLDFKEGTLDPKRNNPKLPTKKTPIPDKDPTGIKQLGNEWGNDKLIDRNDKMLEELKNINSNTKNLRPAPEEKILTV